jgi:hypothetical protein
MANDPGYELEYLHHALEELERYLLSDELFWPVLARPSEGGSFLKLTVGNLLLSLKKLDTLQQSRKLSRPEEGDLRRIQAEIEATQRRWPVAWEEKAGREFRSRFGQWSHVLSDFKKDFEKQAPYYHSEVRIRVLLALLAKQAPEQAGYDLVPLDAFLQGLLTPARFIWPPELEGGFPRDDFWFLYGEMRD